MPLVAAPRRTLLRAAGLLLLAAGAFCGSGVDNLRAGGPQGFDTVVIDAGHGGHDRGGGPGQIVPEKLYTLDTAQRLQRALKARGFRTVMTRTEDVFIPLRERVAVASAQRNAIFVSVHYNSGSRSAARGYETYYYRSDSFGLASRLHQAQLASMDTEDRHVRRRPFYVLRKPSIPAVLCEGGFLTNPDETRIVEDSAYRQRWANNIADALVAQRREGDPHELGNQPPVTTEHFYVGGGRSRHRYYYVHSHGHTHGHSHTSGTKHGSTHKHGSSSSRSSSKKHHHHTSH